MSVNFKTLRSFVTAVEAKSLSAAAQQLHLAQPALSQQIASLELHFKQKLLTRSSAGVTPTRAGTELYRHAQLILSHLEQAEREVSGRTDTISGNVAVGLATYSTTSTLSTPLLMAVRSHYPGINLFINDNFGLVLSEMVMTGRMDMAIIYASGPMKGVKLEPLLTEELFLIAPPGTELPESDGHTIALAAVDGMDMLLPSRTHFLRQLIDDQCARMRVSPHVTAEIESAATLREAIEAGLGATILPAALAGTFHGSARPVVRRIVEPGIQATVSLCVSDHLPMTEHAMAVLSSLHTLVRELFEVERYAGVHAPSVRGA
ncbi:LysR substrate-binding domain-containing protein [Polaromonas jejuensis]|uniref:LysR substrate-binding domain-containing protein n=1 Tax=Polaromonas jejuensis TaxID=457502 RepID=A0ABW0Q552_9BURK|nr:LysR substrate-binding domain-containing protein [Polaromonas jejuensis]